MKVSIGTNLKDGPWGGGNLFAINSFLKIKIMMLFLIYLMMTLI